MLVGAHVSIAGGVQNAPKNGVQLGCDVIQMFCKNQRQWTAKPLTDEEADAFQASYKSSGLRGVFVHDTYLINVGSPDAAMWTKSRDALLDEARRCEMLGIPLLNMHPGSHMGKGPAAGVKRIAEAMRYVLDQTQGSKVALLLESMAGQGTNLGARLEDLRAIREATGNDPRVGYCLDTCHLYAAGFDIANPAGYEATMKRVAEELGLKRVRAFHLNDSKAPLGSHVDRHENIGKGMFGPRGFAPLMRDQRFENVPMALETPLAEEGYRDDLTQLRALAR